MRLYQIVLLFFYAFGMAVGQILFKMAAIKLQASEVRTNLFLFALTSPHYIAAIVIYMGLTFFWVYILTFTELSKAYPFVSLAFLLTPLLASFFFGEKLSLLFLIGLGAIIFGLLLTTLNS